MVLTFCEAMKFVLQTSMDGKTFVPHGLVLSGGGADYFGSGAHDNFFPPSSLVVHHEYASCIMVIL